MYSRNLGRLIREARKRNGVTQERLAEALGIPQTTLSKYETGAVSPSPERLALLLRKLDIDDGEYMAVLHKAAA